jgi:anaerobic magnesium-protoporphyrin IX monomethyl ester cyclase
MRVALVFPRFRYPSGDPPLGLAYLASRLRQQTGVTPVVVDTTFARDPMGMVDHVLAEGRFDLVGISAMVANVGAALAVARLVKRRRPQTLVVMGGPHPTSLPERVLRDPAVDAVAVGEGEDTLAEIVQKGGIAGVPGLWLKEADALRPPIPREPIADLDALPFPALDLFPMESYLASWFQLDTVRPGLRGTTVLATRGCAFNCSFCQPTLARLFGRKLRKRSPANLGDEVAWLKERFKIDALFFTDDTFVTDAAWVRAVCEELRSRHLGVIWGCNVRADLVDRDLLRCMYEAGLRKVYVGIECFSDRIRCDILDKNIKREQISAAVEIARAERVRIQGYFMLGAPTESRGDILDTIRYARRLPIDDAVFNITTPMPGTRLYERYRHCVAVEPEEMDMYKRYAFRPEKGVDQSFVNRARIWAYVWFYLHPARLWHLLTLIFGPHGRKRMWLKIRRVF